MGVRDEWSLLCNRAADQDDLRRFAGSARLNTDDSPYIELNAPKGLYAAAEHIVQDQFAIYNALVGAGRELLPPVVNHPALAEGTRTEDRAVLFSELARIYRQKLQFRKAEKLAEEADRLRAAGR